MSSTNYWNEIERKIHNISRLNYNIYRRLFFGYETPIDRSDEFWCFYVSNLPIYPLLGGIHGLIIRGESNRSVLKIFKSNRGTYLGLGRSIIGVSILYSICSSICLFVLCRDCVRSPSGLKIKLW